VVMGCAHAGTLRRSRRAGTSERNREQTRVLILTSFADDEALFSAIMAGASGYVLKQIQGNDLLDAIHRVANGESLLDPSVTGQVLARIRGDVLGRATMVAFEQLTPQERRIVRACRRGMTNRPDRRAGPSRREDREELREQHPYEARPLATCRGRRVHGQAESTAETPRPGPSAPIGTLVPACVACAVTGSGPCGTGCALHRAEDEAQVKSNKEIPTMTSGIRWRIFVLQIGLIGILGFVSGFAFWGSSFSRHRRCTTSSPHSRSTSPPQAQRRSPLCPRWTARR